MTEAINFWLAKAYVDLLLGLGVIGIFVVLFILVLLVQFLKDL